MDRVFIPSIPTRYDIATGSQIPTVDLNPATAYGELVPMVDWDVEVATLSGAMEVIRQVAEQVGPEDYILIVGDITLVSVAMAFALVRNGRVRVLRWDRDRREYRVIEVETNGDW